jgi:hypothetical protein
VLKPKKNYTKKLNCTQCGTFTVYKYTTRPGARAKNFAAFKCVKCKTLNAKKVRNTAKKATSDVVSKDSLETVIEVKQEVVNDNEVQKRNRKQINFDEKCKKSQLK